MFKFSAEFKTIQDLVSFVSTLGVGQLEKASVETKVESKVEEKQELAEVPPVIESPKKKVAAKKVVKIEAPVEEEMEEVQSPFTETTPEPVDFDRVAAIAKATELVAVLKKTGISDDKIMPAIHEVYAQAGCALNLKISQFDDESLEKFIPLFELKVNSIAATQASKPVSTSSSFI